MFDVEIFAENKNKQFFKIFEEEKKQGQLAVVMGRGRQAMQDVETFLWEEHSRCAYVRV